MSFLPEEQMSGLGTNKHNAKQRSEFYKPQREKDSECTLDFAIHNNATQTEYIVQLQSRSSKTKTFVISRTTTFRHPQESSLIKVY